MKKVCVDKALSLITMGCVASKQDFNDTHPNIFSVLNVDEDGNKLNKGQLEVTDSKLVFHQKGKPQVRWPLRCLRRYGYDSDLFSFESGRKSDTGPGIYAFKCDRAEQLFNLLQSKVRSHREPATDSTIPRPPEPILPQRPFSDVITQSSPAAVAGGPEQGPVYINWNNNEPVDQVPMPTFQAPRPPSTNSPTRIVAGDPRHDYENVGVDAASVDMTESVFVSAGELPLPPKPPKLQQPAVVVPTDLPEPVEAAEQPSSELDGVTPGDDDEETKQVNYIEVEINIKTPPPPLQLNGETLEPSVGEGYATIDFDRTVALNNSANPEPEDEPGVRKTRHNSTLSDLPTSVSTKRNSVVSE